MPSQAPYHYIRDYYRQVHAKYTRFPEMAAFCRDWMKQVTGESVLNAGCGPLLYDDLPHFGAVPRDYVGLDINRNTFAFLKRSRDPRLLRAKAHAHFCGTRVEHLCGDALALGLEDRFSSVLGVGFFATFYGPDFAPLMAVMHRALKSRGRLVKLTWHGPNRTREVERDKLKYRYDRVRQPAPEELVAAVEAAGFVFRDQAILDCDPLSYGWEAIQACVFERG